MGLEHLGVNDRKTLLVNCALVDPLDDTRERIAIALAADPAPIVADEPVTSVDASSQVR